MIIVSLNVRFVLSSTSFATMYDMMMRLDVDVLLLQKSNISKELFDYYENRFSQILIISNCTNNRDVSIIINIKITTWSEEKDEASHIIYKDNDNRLLVCSINHREHIVIIVFAYVSIKEMKKLSWLNFTIKNLKNNSLSIFCDVIEEDWNLILLSKDRVTHIESSNTRLATLHQLLEILRNQQSLIDDWRERNSNIRAFIYFANKNNRLVVKIDRIYIRENWMFNTNDWEIEFSDIVIDHKAITITIRFTIQSNRDSNKWRVNLLLLKKRIIKQECLDVMNCLLNENLLKKWNIYKIKIVAILKKSTKRFKHENNKLKYNLRRRRLKLQKKRRKRARLNKTQLDVTLKELIATMKTREKHLFDVFNQNYAYNAIIKHLILNEKSTK